MNDKPIPESYWVLPDQFLAGEYPGIRFKGAQTRQCLKAFLNAGFNTFIDLSSEHERPPYFFKLSVEARILGREVHHQRFSFPDFNVPSRQIVVAILNAIDAALAGDRKVYLHCVAGIGRTGVTVGCYLIRHGMTPPAALQSLQELYRTSAQSLIYPEAPETEKQVAFILNWKEDGLA